jgi:hypothetical protein
MLVCCLAYYSTLKMQTTCFSEKLLTFNGLNGVISQKIQLFITTDVRTSNSTRIILLHSFKRLVFVMETQSVFCEVGTESLNII